MSFMEDFDHLKIEMKDIVSATNNFDRANVIGRGGFGSVYKGELSTPEGQITVAFKQLNRSLGQGKVEFWKEVMMLSKYKHENLITLMHYCIDDDQMILVYEYASRGSLEKYLTDACTLTWIQRLKISVGVARGLEFLHDPKETQQRLIHRDIKSGNILLDENWMAKVSDFGLSKVAPANQQYTYLISHTVGTPGYCDPLYMELGFLSKESDVYSFGVVLFEILCGRLCCEYHEGVLTKTLVAKWRRCYEEEKLDEIILPDLIKQMDPNSLRLFSTIAYKCLNKDREDRPTMAQVLLELEFSLEQQELLENHRKTVGFLELMQQKKRASQESSDEYKLAPESKERTNSNAQMHQPLVINQGLNSESSMSNKFQDWADEDYSQPSPGSDENDSFAILRMDGRGARYGSADHIRNADSSGQAVELLVEVLNTGSEKAQHTAIVALVRLLSENPLGVLAVADVEMNSVDILCRILLSNCSIDVKRNAAELCCLFFGNTRIRSSIAAAHCVEPLISLLVSKSSRAQHSVVRALDKLVDDEKLADLVSAYGAIIPLVGLLRGRNYILHEASSRVLVKLGKDRPSCMMEMAKAGVIESISNIIHEAPDFLCAAFAELLEILTNNAAIAKGQSAAKVVKPLLLLLTKTEVGPDGQVSALQVLVNIFEHPQCRVDCTLSSHRVIEPLIPLLDSHASAVQGLSAELVSQLLLDEHYQKDPISRQVIGPLLRVLGSGIPISQQRVVKALNSLAVTWPNVIAKEGVVELSKVVLLADPSLVLWKSATAILSSILPFSSELFLELPLALLVRLLGSGCDATISGALDALFVLGSNDSSNVVAMADSGAIKALLDLLACHQYEENTARLLKFLLTNDKVRETKAAKFVILPLSQYLSDPQTQAQQAKLSAAIALGDLFQNVTLAESADAVSACHAMVNLLEDEASEEMILVAISGLQNLVRFSDTNKRAVAKAGGVQLIVDLISSRDANTSVLAAMLMELLFSTSTIQEYASSETVIAITSAIEMDFRATGTMNIVYLKALNELIERVPSLIPLQQAVTLSPHLVTSLKTGSNATNEAALDTLFFLRKAWSICLADVATGAIPLLQYLIRSGPPRLQEKAKLVLLHCMLPGTLTVSIKRGTNMPQPMGVFCKLTLLKNPTWRTKVSMGPNPKWDESFSWCFESPPIGQTLHISCKDKSKIWMNSFGRVTIPINEVMMLGKVVGEYTLLSQSESGAPRTLEVESEWLVSS